MNKPTSAVQLFVVCAPGIDPSTVQVKSSLEVLGWKFSDMDRGDLIDLAAQVDSQLKVLGKWHEAAKGVLKQTLPVPADPGTETVTLGRKFEAHYVKMVRSDIDRDSVKRDMGDKWYGEHCKTTEVLQLKIVPIAQTPGAAG